MPAYGGYVSHLDQPNSRLAKASDMGDRSKSEEPEKREKASMFVNLCNCGGHIHEAQHTLVSLRGLWQWMPCDDRSALPANVTQRTCVACGRYEASITTAQGQSYAYRPAAVLA